MAYQAKLAIKDLQLHHFLPKDSLYGLSLTASAKGVGTDFFSRHTRMQADMTLESLQYGQLHLSDIKLDAGLQKATATSLSTAITRYWICVPESTRC